MNGPAEQEIAPLSLSPHKLVTIQQEAFHGLPPSVTTPEALAFYEKMVKEFGGGQPIQPSLAPLLRFEIQGVALAA